MLSCKTLCLINAQSSLSSSIIKILFIFDVSPFIRFHILVLEIQSHSSLKRILQAYLRLFCKISFFPIIAGCFSFGRLSNTPFPSCTSNQKADYYVQKDAAKALNREI